LLLDDIGQWSEKHLQWHSDNVSTATTDIDYEEKKASNSTTTTTIIIAIAESWRSMGGNILFAKKFHHP
jgi:hypothetical protein